MKKVRNGFVKNLNYLCLAGVIAVGLMTIIATGGGGGGGAPAGTAPKITNVNLYDAFWDETYSFTIGEDANFRVYATDPDLDMTTLFITQYYPADSDTPFYGPDSLSLPSQIAPDMYYYNIDPAEVTGPAGDWRLEFQIEDSKGHDSNVFIVYASIH